MAIAIFVVKGAANYGQSVLMNQVGQRIIADLQTRMFGHLMRADLAFYHDTATGTLISRFTNDVNLLRAAVSTALTGIVKELLTLVFLVGVMVYQDWTLALIACVIFPIAILPVVKIGKRMRKLARVLRDARVVEMPGCGHNVHLECPDAVIQATTNTRTTSSGFSAGSIR